MSSHTSEIAEVATEAEVPPASEAEQTGEAEVPPALEAEVPLAPEAEQTGEAEVPPVAEVAVPIVEPQFEDDQEFLEVYIWLNVFGKRRPDGGSYADDIERITDRMIEMAQK